MAIGDNLSTIVRSSCPQLLLFLTPLYSLSPVCFALFPVASLPFFSLFIQFIRFFEVNIRMSRSKSHKDVLRPA